MANATTLSRREFGRVIAAGVPLLLPAGSATALSAVTRAAALSPVVLGVSTLSFRDLPREEGVDNVDDVIRALKAVRATHIELAMGNVEPAPPSTAAFVGGTPAYPRRVTFTPEQVAAINAFARRGLRQWRAETEPKYFVAVRDKFAAAGLTVAAASLAYDESFDDDEIEATFRQFKALGVPVVSSPMTLATARRIAQFAERHGAIVAIHNQVDGNPAGSIATPQLGEALALSPAFRLKLDIGHLTASNQDPLAVLAAHEERIAHVLVRDRLRNGGASRHFGEGDTPIGAVIARLKSSARSIPAIIEYDYVGLHSSVEEVTAAMAYVSGSAR
jgi:sugar phosphate isomerase/epimerase